MFVCTVCRRKELMTFNLCHEHRDCLLFTLSNRLMIEIIVMFICLPWLLVRSVTMLSHPWNRALPICNKINNLFPHIDPSKNHGETGLKFQLNNLAIYDRHTLTRLISSSDYLWESSRTWSNDRLHVSGKFRLPAILGLSRLYFFWIGENNSRLSEVWST